MKGNIAFLPFGYAFPNSFLYARCFFAAQMYICPEATTRNTHAEDCSQNSGHSKSDNPRTHVTSCHHCDAEPTNSFKEIIWERDKREPVSIWDSTLPGSRWSKIAEVDMGDQIGYFGKLGLGLETVQKYMARDATYNPNTSTRPDERRIVPDRPANVG